MKTLFIERGSPWENGYIESFNDKLRYELYGKTEAEILRQDKLVFSQDDKHLREGNTYLERKIAAPQVTCLIGEGTGNISGQHQTDEEGRVWRILKPKGGRRRPISAFHSVARLSVLLFAVLGTPIDLTSYGYDSTMPRQGR